MFMSISAMSNGLAAPRSRSSASTPSSASTTSMPQAPSMFSSTVRLVRLSSATSTRSAERSPSSPSTAASPGSARTGSVKRNSEPMPGALRTPIVPPISSTSWREIARPRPVPP
jgi:hypothetical protein